MSPMSHVRTQRMNYDVEKLSCLRGRMAIRRWTSHLNVGDAGIYCLGVLIARHTFMGVSGMSMLVTPYSLSASSTALTMAGGAPQQPASPAPLTPRGLRRVGELSSYSTIMAGTVSARGMA